MSDNLLQIAVKINKLAAETTNNYVELGKLLIKARDVVKKENFWGWREWCRLNLHKEDGTPFSPKTLENYIYLAAKPERVEKQKKMQRANLQKIRKKAAGVETADAVVNLFSKHTKTEDQVNILMTAWGYACKDAQEQFLDLIGARI